MWYIDLHVIRNTLRVGAFSLSSSAYAGYENYASRSSAHHEQRDSLARYSPSATLNCLI